MLSAGAHQQLQWDDVQCPAWALADQKSGHLIGKKHLFDGKGWIEDIYRQQKLRWACEHIRSLTVGNYSLEPCLSVSDLLWGGWPFAMALPGA